MKILKFEVIGINNSNKIHNLIMNSDLNIITGRNGAGKTTTLKLLWLLISGNIKQSLSECEFNSVEIITDSYYLYISKNPEDKVSDIFYTEDVDSVYIENEELDGFDENLTISYSENDDEYSFDNFDLNHNNVVYEDKDNIGVSKEISYDGKLRRILLSKSDKLKSKLNNTISALSDKLVSHGSSLYFPTFRRIEGGFSLSNIKSRASLSSDLEEAMANLSKRFTRGKHLFVSSLSMSDVSQFLLKEYSNLNDISANQTNQLSQQVIGMIKFRKDNNNNLKEANVLLSEVLEKIEKIEENRTLLMRPLTTVQKVVSDIFKHKGIHFGENLNFGDAASAVNSDKLSAGEKQLLSFICYNAFFDDAIFIIDEPELSLHVDWQRSFFKILMDQNPSNQFIVTTHSPFIYGKYPDKEVALNSDRGESEG